MRRRGERAVSFRLAAGPDPRLALLVFFLACGDQPIELEPGFPEVPLPSYATSVETHSENRLHLERFFVPGEGHSLEEVRVFYGNWAERAGWQKLEPSEELWSGDSWHEYYVGDTRTRQFLVHWADPSSKWSLRLAMRMYPESGERGVWVIVQPFFNLDQVEPLDS